MNDLRADVKELNIIVRTKVVDPLIDREKNLRHLSLACASLHEEAEKYFKVCKIFFLLSKVDKGSRVISQVKFVRHC